jgi:quinol monooxygenase YgiN
MSVYVIAEFPFSEKGAQEFMDWTKSDDGYAVTKAWGGFELIQTLLAEDNKTIYLYEKWASKEEHRGYLNMRVEGGLMDFLGPRLEGEFKFHYFNDVD